VPITSIGSGVFEQDANLKKVTIGTNVASIGNGAFTNCSSLTNIVIPNNVTSIGDYAFFITAPYGGLMSATIGSGVTNIGSYAFYNNSLGNVYFLGNAPNVDATSFD